MKKLPRSNDWKPRITKAVVDEICANLPPGRDAFFRRLATGDYGGPRLSLEDLHYKWGDYTEPIREAIEARDEPTTQAEILKQLRKATEVGAFSCPEEYKQGDRIFDRTIIPMPTFTVYQESKNMKPRRVTDMARRPERKFDLTLAIKEHPEHKNYLRQLYKRTGGRPALNDLYEKKDTTMKYETLRDTAIALDLSYKEPWMLTNDWFSWFDQVPLPRHLVYTGMYTFAYWSDTGALVIVTVLRHTHVMGDAQSAWICNTYDRLLHESWARKRGPNLLRPSDRLTGSDWGLATGHTVIITLGTQKTKNRLSIAHESELILHSFRNGWKPFHSNVTVYQDDTAASTNTQLECKNLRQQIMKLAKHCNVRSSAIEEPARIKIFRGYEWDGTRHEVRWPTEKWGRLVKKVQRITSNPRATGELLLQAMGLLEHRGVIFPELRPMLRLLSSWLGQLNPRCHDKQPHRAKKKWSIAKTIEYDVPPIICKTLKEIMGATEGKVARTINLVLDPLDAIQAGPGDEPKINWDSIPKWQINGRGSVLVEDPTGLFKVIAYANHKGRVAYIWSIDVSPPSEGKLGGVGIVSHSWGPYTPGQRRRKPGDYIFISWEGLLQDYISICSTAFELMGTNLFLKHQWATEVSLHHTRAKQHGAKPVFILLKDNSGEIQAINANKMRQGYLAPACRYRHLVEKLGVRVFAIHCQTDVIPADVPSRTDKLEWQSNLQERMINLGLDLNRQGVPWDAPADWKEEVEATNTLQANYRYDSLR